MNNTANKEDYIKEILTHKLYEKYKATLMIFTTNKYFPIYYHCVIRRQDGTHFWVDVTKDTLDFNDLDNSLNGFIEGLKLI